MSKSNGILIVGGLGAAAYFFWPQLSAALGLPAAAATTTGSTAAPAMTAAQMAAAAATAAGATPAQAAGAGVAAANNTPPASITAPVIPPTPPTITVDSPDTHNALAAYANADSAATLARAQTGYAGLAADYVLTVSQWNYYVASTGGTQTITGPTSAGDNAISAAQYLALRGALGLLPVQRTSTN